ncbi:MAG: thioredoxin [Schwartzia sp.]|nr:thioredoxin [Schwartzia sp. (in: firmicutes)]
MSKPAIVTADNFEQEVLNAEGRVLVDFWADWCGPCRMLSPIIEEIAAEHDDMKVCKINVDENPSLAQQYNVMSIPMVIMFEKGKITGQTVGFQPKDFLLRSLEL